MTSVNKNLPQKIDISCGIKIIKWKIKVKAIHENLTIIWIFYNRSFHLKTWMKFDGETGLANEKNNSQLKELLESHFQEGRD